MPLYRYAGYGVNGKAISGMVDAEDQVSARRSLKERGIFLTAPLRVSQR